MSWLTRRQSVIAQNVANADTPGYVSKDLKEPKFDRMVSHNVSQVTPAKTHAKHFAIKSASSSDPNMARVEKNPDWETTPDGNSVVLEQQMIKMSTTQIEFQAATELYRKSLNMIRLAIRKN